MHSFMVSILDHEIAQMIGSHHLKVVFRACRFSKLSVKDILNNNFVIPNKQSQEKIVNNDLMIFNECFMSEKRSQHFTTKTHIKENTE